MSKYCILDIYSFVTNPSAPGVESAILKRFGKAPFTVRGGNVAVLLAKGFDAVRAAALQKALHEGGGENKEEK